MSAKRASFQMFRSRIPFCSRNHEFPQFYAGPVWASGFLSPYAVTVWFWGLNSKTLQNAVSLGNV